MKKTLLQTHKIINKTIYGGMLVDKYFLILDDRTEIQVRFSEWEKYQKGDEYPQPTESL